ncbi:MAG: hypothetical protein H7Z15_22295 [Rhizobacter sp.]|nr:hypothetical protein [Rhizobacter sp.]
MSQDWIMAASMAIGTDLVELLGYAASGLVLVTFSVRSICALRSVAIASNLMFIAYAACAGLMPVLVLHAVLLPLNVVRLRQSLRESQAALRPTPSTYLKQKLRAD